MMAFLLISSLFLIFSGCCSANTNADGGSTGGIPILGRPTVWKDIALGSNVTCGVRSNGAAVCWGTDEPLSPVSKPLITESTTMEEQMDLLTKISSSGGWSYTLKGDYSSVVVVHDVAYFTSDDGAITCWAEFGNQNECEMPPGGQYSQLTFGSRYGCGLSSSGEVNCWGNSDSGQQEVPETRFVDVSAGNYHVCGVTTESTVECWGGKVETGPPSGVKIYDTFESETGETCGFYDSAHFKGNMRCWGQIDWMPPSPEGSFIAITSGISHTCGIRADSSLACWGCKDFNSGQCEPPEGKYKAVATEKELTCAISEDGGISCWGGDTKYDSWNNVPLGNYIKIGVEDSRACGIRDDGTCACWGMCRAHSCEVFEPGSENEVWVPLN